MRELTESRQLRPTPIAKRLLRPNSPDFRYETSNDNLWTDRRQAGITLLKFEPRQIFKKKGYTYSYPT